MYKQPFATELDIGGGQVLVYHRMEEQPPRILKVLLGKLGH